MGTLIAIGGMLIFFGVTLGGKPKPQAAPKPTVTPVPTQPTTNVKAAPAQVAAVSATSDPTEQLKKLAELHKSGVLTDEEYAAAKKKVLDI